MNIGKRLYQILGAFSARTLVKPFLISSSSRAGLKFSRPYWGVWKATFAFGFGSLQCGLDEFSGYGAGDFGRAETEIVELGISVC